MMASINTTYEPFSKQPEYVELNRSFIQSVLPHLNSPSVVVDVACGIGVLTGLLASELQGQMVAGAVGDIGRARKESLTILGVDLSRESLVLARDELTWAGILGRPGVQPTPGPHQRAVLVQGSGDRLPTPSAVADAVLLGNAIHLFADKHRLVQEVCRVLRPQGVFAFNTAFYEGGRLEGTDRFYDEWFKQALRYVKRREGERRTDGVEVSARRRGSGRVAFSNPLLSVREYRALVEGCGFRVEKVTERTLEMSSSNLEAIGSYSEFATAKLGGYPVELACEALVRTVAPALEALGLVTVRRSWLELVAVKP